MGTVSVLKISATNDFLGRIPFFASLGPEKAREVARLVVRKHFRKNQVVLVEEETENFMYLVYSGSVKVVQFQDQGVEQILTIHKRGDFFGEMALLDGKTAPATVIAMEESEIGLLSKDDFSRHVLGNEDAFRQVITALCERLREAWFMIRVMGFSDAESRVSAVLDHLARLHGVKDARGTLLPLKLTHKEIADYASISRETVTRLLGRLTREGEIEILENRHILLKPAFSKKLHLL
ncbi:MAG: Crp/Fnr family transcriptional regulator [Geobacter sp.]|nr:Crp/Fnr family transcriptional regulator [Geobacter sp.]